MSAALLPSDATRSAVPIGLAVLVEVPPRLPVGDVVAARAPVVALAPVRDVAATALLAAAEVPADAAAHEGTSGRAAYVAAQQCAGGCADARASGGAAYSWSHAGAGAE